ncbi:MAG TPA: DUF4410 domain-containing protein [Candidatus Binatia bacterium]
MKNATFFCLLAAALAGCAATRVSNLSEAPPPASGARPVAIYVSSFEVDPSAIKQSSGVLGDLQQEANQRPRPLASLLGRRPVLGGPPTEDEAIGLLAQSITDALNAKQLGVPAIRVQPDQPTPSNGWIVGGRIVNVDPGNAARSATVGFGTGESQVEVQVDVVAMRDGARTQLLSFSDSAQSRKTPGGLVMMNPYAMAAKFVVSRNATEREIQQLGGQIADEIAAYLNGGASAS